jgi:hypothetical protein
MREIKTYGLSVVLILFVTLGYALEYTNSQLGFRVTLPDGLDDFSANMRVKTLISRGRMDERGPDRLIIIRDLGGIMSRENSLKAGRQPEDTTLEKTSWKGFELDVLRGVERMDDLTFVTFDIRLPLTPRAIQILVTGRESDERHLRGELDKLLGSVEGKSNWSVTGGIQRAAPRQNLVSVLIGLVVLLTGRLRISRHYGLQGVGARVCGFVILAAGVVLPEVTRLAMPLVRATGLHGAGLFITWMVINCTLVWAAIVILVRHYGNAYAKDANEIVPEATAVPPLKSIEVVITHCRLCQSPVPADQQRSARACSNCGADLSRQKQYG